MEAAEHLYENVKGIKSKCFGGDNSQDKVEEGLSNFVGKVIKKVAEKGSSNHLAFKDVCPEASQNDELCGQIQSISDSCGPQDPLELLEALRETVVPVSAPVVVKKEENEWELLGLVEAGKKCLENRSDPALVKVSDCGSVVYESQYGGFSRLALNWLMPLKYGSRTPVQELVDEVTNQLYSAGSPNLLSGSSELSLAHQCVVQKKGSTEVVNLVQKTKSQSFVQKATTDSTVENTGQVAIIPSQVAIQSSFVERRGGGPKQFLKGAAIISFIVLATTSVMMGFGGYSKLYYAYKGFSTLLKVLEVVTGYADLLLLLGKWLKSSTAYKQEAVGQDFVKTCPNVGLDTVKKYFKHVNCVKDAQYSAMGDGSHWLLSHREGVIRQAEVCNKEQITDCFPKARWWVFGGHCQGVTKSDFLETANLLRENSRAVAINLLSSGGGGSFQDSKVSKMIQKTKRTGKIPGSKELDELCNELDICDDQVHALELIEAFVLLLEGRVVETSNSITTVTVYEG